jgi:hypothetical protein
MAEPIISLALLIILLIGFPMIAVFVIMMIESMGSKKTKFLFFESKDHCRMLNQYVKDGKVKIGKKEFHIGDTKPKLMKTGTLFRVFKPLYVLNHKNIRPYQWNDEAMEINLTTESGKLLSRNTTLETLLKGGQGGGAWIFIIIGIVIGVMVGYMLVSAGVLPVQTAVNATTQVAQKVVTK